MKLEFDSVDQGLLNLRVANRANISDPVTGDYIYFQTGELERISCIWGSGVQTSPSGSFYLMENGYASFSGGHNPVVQTQDLILTPQELPGDFWFFHHNLAGPSRGVYFSIPCRVYTTHEKYAGFLGKDFQSERTLAKKRMLEIQIPSWLKEMVQ